MLDSVSIQECIQAILAACPAGSRVILFGSRARGDHHPDSDVDLLVVEPEPPARLVEAARLARVVRRMRVPADIVVIGQEMYEQWKDAPNSIYNEAARDGKVFV